VALAGGGRFVPMPFAFQLLAVHGPIARHVPDLRLAFAHMCARSGGDPWHAPVALDGPPPVAPIRVTVVDLPETHPDVADAVRECRRSAGRCRFRGGGEAGSGVAWAGEIFVQIMSRFGRVHGARQPLVVDLLPLTRRMITQGLPH
jgi:amidase